MADNYLIEDNANLVSYPGPCQVLLDASVNGVLGNMVCTVAGYGQVPAAGNKDTGQMRGAIVDAADNTGGAQGALAVTAKPGQYRGANDGTHPCAQADVGHKVYASSGTTFSNNSGDGPLAGILQEFNAADSYGRPCKVALMCFPIA